MRRHFVLTGLCATMLCTPVHAQIGRVDYAKKCAEEMGPLPETINCMEGTVLPIKTGNTEHKQTVATCDRPPQLTLIDKGARCVPFSRVRTIDTGKPNVLTVLLCRKYFDRGLTDADREANTTFDDVAIIQHNSVTGRTCFFQSKVSTKVGDPGFVGTQVPSPADETFAGEVVWMTTNEIRSSTECTKCHAADPFVWSPYIVQVLDESAWNPRGRYDSNFQNLFGAPSQTFQPQGNRCIDCHRFGRGPKPNDLARPDRRQDIACNKLVHDYIDRGKAHVTRAKADELWMPIFPTPDSERAKFTASINQILSCCADPNQLACRSDIADGRFPRTESGEVLRATGAACNALDCPGWLRLDNARTTRALAASDATLYQLRENGVILRSTGTPCNGTFCDAGWTPLDRNPLTIAIAAGAGVLHQLRGDGTIWRFTGTACSSIACTGWVQLGDDPKTVAIAMGGIGLQRLDRDGAVWRFVGPACGKKGCTGWQRLDDNPDTVGIAATPEAIYQLHKTGVIRRYTGKPCNANGCPGWQMIDNNPETVAIAAAGSQLYQLHGSGLIWRFNGIACTADGCPGWRPLDNNPKTVAIAAAGNNLYQLHADGAVWRFTGRPCDAGGCNGWIQLDDDGATTMIVAGGDRLYQLRQERGTDRRAELLQRPRGMAASRPR